MPNLQEASPVGAPKPALHPSYLAWIHEGALLTIIHGDAFANLPWSAGEKAHMEAEADALRAQGVGPERASALLDRIGGGRNLHAIEGGGEASPGRRPNLYLVRDARSR